MANKFVWYDVMTTDVEAAGKFYSAVAGWRAQDSGMPGQEYTLLFNGDVQVGGIMAIPQDQKGMPPCWTGYIGVSDVDDYARRIEGLGGNIWKAPQDIPGVGRFAVVADPQGAAFIIFKGNLEAEPAPVPFMAKGHIGWHELHAVDYKAAFDFYSGLFGWQLDAAHDMGGFTYQTFKIDGEFGAGGMMNKMDADPMPHWNYYFSVGDTDAAAKRVADNGGKLLMDVMQVPGGAWIAPCMDPQGAHFNIIGMKGQA